MKRIFRILHVPIVLDTPISSAEDEQISEIPISSRSIKIYEIVMSASTFFLYLITNSLSLWTCWQWPHLISLGYVAISLLITIRNRYVIQPQLPVTARWRSLLILYMIAIGILAGVSVAQTVGCKVPF